VKKIYPKLFGFAMLIFGLAFFTVMFTAGFFLTAYLYQIINLHPPFLLVQIINSLLGLLLVGLVAGGGSNFARSRGWTPEIGRFGPILEALEKIAQGNFNIRLDNELQDHQIVGKLASSVNKMALELDQMENLRQEFISNVSHEIQSPLTSIRGFAQALENDQLSPEERHHYLSIIEDESTRLSRITEDLLRLAALESDRVRFEPAPYRLDHQIRSLILVCEPQWTEKKIELEVSLEDVEITADEDLLSQVWLNLIHNSIKFTPPGGSISVALCRYNDKIEFRISDTGLGIAAEDQAHIFERFYKADKSRTRSKEGSGLGLSIVKKIVDMHQGTIQVESRLSAGTTFIVSLPVKG
jgi:two-component system, OmpR family, phosphate regulon sensor histidine kinase PhoR